MSTPPPSMAPPGAGGGAALREFVLALESSRGRRRRGGEDALRLSAMGAVLQHEGALRAPLRLPLGTLQLGAIDPGAADGQSRFPVLRRLSASVVVPREHGIEGWLWTRSGGTGLTVLADEGVAPNVALLFTKPLGEDVIAPVLAPDVLADVAARSPLGAPAVYGVLLRVADTVMAENTFRQFSLLRPLTDREVPPTLRRHLPEDRSVDMVLPADAAAPVAGSVAPPGLG